MWTINTDVFLAHFGSSFDHKRFIIHLAINQQITQPTYAASNTTDYHNSSKTLPMYSTLLLRKLIEL